MLCFIPGGVWYVYCYVRKKLFSGVFAITEGSDMGLYEVPLSISLLGFGMGTMSCLFCLNIKYVFAIISLLGFVMGTMSCLFCLNIKYVFAIIAGDRNITTYNDIYTLSIYISVVIFIFISFPGWGPSARTATVLKVMGAKMNERAKWNNMTLKERRGVSQSPLK